ncbi:PRD domain-containing protein [Enterococcus sp. HY326]|uniref:PRD domain-containing protein n=1 Tax=Enterococcus sp. HY326 TaxID=2971265 RepID=UPI00223F8CFD|nr:PRD domain-containing protein [Enterococcus sp. HY326]
MLVKKRINNNVILAVKNDGETDEQVIIGKGIGFQVYPGDPVDIEKIQKVYLPTESLNLATIGKLLQDASMEDFRLVERIVTYGEEILQKKIGQGIIFSLMDHLLFALSRYQDEMTIKSPLEWEIRQFYPKEFSIGQGALAIIAEERGICLSESEAALIALHFINYEFGHDSLEKTMDFMEAIKDITRLIQFQCQVDLDEQSFEYQRFLNHLRYFIIRLQNTTTTHSPLDNEDLLFSVKQKYPKEFQLSLTISEFIEERYQRTAEIDENLYLTLHLARLLNN